MVSSLSDNVQYKMDIMKRMGGESMFEFIVLSLVESIKNDPKLDECFSTFSDGDLALHETFLLKAMFTKHPQDYDVNGYILLRNYDIIQRGFNEKHFDIIVNQHLVQAMEDSWVDQKAIHDAVSMLQEFRCLFGKDDDFRRQTPKKAATNVDDLSASERSRVVQQQKIVDALSASERTRRAVQQKQGLTAPAGRRSSSGEFLLRRLQTKGSKRTKQ